MDVQQLKALQAPLKERYKTDPTLSDDHARRSGSDER